MNSTHSITQAQIHDYAHGLLADFLKVKDYGKTCSASMLISLLLFAATRAASLSAACRRLAGAPSDETARQALIATLPGYIALERRINAALAQPLPKILRKRPSPIAIDLCDLPYYGKPGSKDVRRGPKKASTVRFHTYATAFVVRKGYRFTVAATRVTAGEKQVDVLKRLLRRVSDLGIRIRFLLLDRGFFAVDIVNYLKRTHRPFVMPTKHQGRKPKDPTKAKSTRRFLTWRRGGWSEHTWKDKHGRTATVNIAVSLRSYTHRQQQRRQVLVFAYWGFQPSSPVWLREAYRKRFAIETSFRQVNQARINTSTQDPVRRFLFVAIALIVRNLWAWIHLVHLAIRGHVHLEVLAFVDMLHTIENFIEVLLKCIDMFGLPTPSLATT